MGRSVFVFLFFGMVNCFYGQLLASDSASFDMKAAIGGSINTGNFQRTGITGNADITYNMEGGKFGFLNHSQYNYSRTSGELAENDILTRTLFYTKLSKRWYALFILWFETNKLRQMQPLVQGGPSLQYVWLSKKDHMSGVSVGATYEHKHYKDHTFNDPQYSTNNINTTRFFARLHGRNKIGISKLSLAYDIYYMPSFQYHRNYRVHAETTLEVPLSKHLNLHAGINYNYESVVILDVKPNDFFTEYGLSINF